jgi:hypothetical protein
MSARGVVDPKCLLLSGVTCCSLFMLTVAMDMLLVGDCCNASKAALAWWRRKVVGLWLKEGPKMSARGR